MSNKTQDEGSEPEASPEPPEAAEDHVTKKDTAVPIKVYARLPPHCPYVGTFHYAPSAKNRSRQNFFRHLIVPEEDIERLHVWKTDAMIGAIVRGSSYMHAPTHSAIFAGCRQRRGGIHSNVKTRVRASTIIAAGQERSISIESLSRQSSHSPLLNKRKSPSLRRLNGGASLSPALASDQAALDKYFCGPELALAPGAGADGGGGGGGGAAGLPIIDERGSPEPGAAGGGHQVAFHTPLGGGGGGGGMGGYGRLAHTRSEPLITPPGSVPGSLDSRGGGGGLMMDHHLGAGSGPRADRQGSVDSQASHASHASSLSAAGLAPLPASAPKAVFKYQSRSSSGRLRSQSQHVMGGTYSLVPKAVLAEQTGGLDGPGGGGGGGAGGRRDSASGAPLSLGQLAGAPIRMIGGEEELYVAGHQMYQCFLTNEETHLILKERMKRRGENIKLQKPDKPLAPVQPRRLSSGHGLMGPKGAARPVPRGGGSPPPRPRAATLAAAAALGGNSNNQQEDGGGGGGSPLLSANSATPRPAGSQDMFFASDEDELDGFGLGTGDPRERDSSASFPGPEQNSPKRASPGGGGGAGGAAAARPRSAYRVTYMSNTAGDLSPGRVRASDEGFRAKGGGGGGSGGGSPLRGPRPHTAGVAEGQPRARARTIDVGSLDELGAAGGGGDRHDPTRNRGAAKAAAARGGEGGRRAKGARFRTATRRAEWAVDLEKERRGTARAIEGAVPYVMQDDAHMGNYTLKDNFEFGEGSFAAVYLATHKDTGVKVAIKQIKKRYLFSENEKASVWREIENHQRASNHRNITTLFEIFETPDHINMVIELADCGDLEKMLQTRRTLTEVEAKRVVKQLLEGLKNVHEQDLVHLDLKPANILFAHDPEVRCDTCGSSLGEWQAKTPGAPPNHNSPSALLLKICDFGMSRKVPDVRYFKATGDVNKIPFTALTGTEQYMAPEILLKEPYGKPADLWSVGVLMYKLLAGIMPFIPTRACFARKPAFPGYMWDKFSLLAPDMVGKLLTVNPDERLTVAQALQHPWLDSVYHLQVTFPHFKICPAARRGSGDQTKK